MHKYIILLFLLFSAVVSFAGNATNVRARQEGQTMVITYDLSKNSVVRIWMATGNSEQYTELQAVSGDVGKGVSAGKNRKIIWKPLEEREEFVAKNVRFKVEAMSSYEYYTHNAKIKTLVLGQLGYSIAPQLSYGAMIGQMYREYGWFVSGRSNFYFSEPTALACNAEGYIDGERPFYSGNSTTTHYVINGGFMMNVLEQITKNKFNTLGFYVGAGYGKRELQWETAKGEWVTFNSDSYKGISANIGVFGSVHGLTLNVGVNTIAFKYMEIEVGVGYMF